MTWIWLLVASMSMTCEVTVESVADVLLERVLDEGVGTMELAEIISSAAASLEEYAPDTDHELLAVTARDGRPVPVSDLRATGLLLVDGEGRLAFTIGRGMILMMLAGDLVTVLHPEPSVFVAAYQLPGFMYWKA